MAGGTPQHAALGAAVSAALLAQLRGGPRRVYSSDLRIRVAATGLATYPDVTVVCGRSERDPANEVTVVNPRVVVEVLSPGTEDYDRGEKLEHYKQIQVVGWRWSVPSTRGSCRQYCQQIQQGVGRVDVVLGCLPVL